ncbi:MAG: alpha/beta hydrolase [Phycisphaerales bacterium]
MKKDRFVLTATLVAPFVIVGGLFAYASDEASQRREARLASAERGTQPAAGGAATNSSLVKPESLAQGFVLVVKDLAGLASADSPIHLASSHNGWDPGDAKQVLTARSDLRWQIELPKPTKDGPLEFKFTRGSWDRCEAAADLTDVSNRLLPTIDVSKLKPGEKPVFEFEVPKWSDQRPNSAARPDLNPYYDIKDVAGTIRRVQVAGGGVPALRDVLVWLPPGYDDAASTTRTYPVLYMQDGQNLFMKMPSIPAEWGADETAARLIGAGEVQPFIIVGIPHAGGARASEYLPISVLPGVEPTGDAYVRFVVDEVMPRIERGFRVKTGPENTSIGGSSLGAIIAMHAACQHPEKFGAVLLESPSWTLGDGAVLAFFEKQKTWPKRIYFGYGGKEFGTDEKAAAGNAAYVALCRKFEGLVQARVQEAAGSGRTFLFRDEGTEHNEAAWADRFPAPVNFLFAPAAR